jgi:hypothetical protein
MNVTRDVIMDLYPLYREGGASEDTRRLVEDFVDADPEFRRFLALGGEAELPATPAPVPEAEMAILARTKGLIGLRSVIMGLAIFVTLLPFSGRLTSGSMEWIFLGRPRVAAVMLLAAAGLWLGYAAVNRRLRGTGL